MSKANALAGLIGNYGDSDEESDEEPVNKSNTLKIASAPMIKRSMAAVPTAQLAQDTAEPSATIHPAPIPHCPWSACYDEGSGFTYYWNQNTNEVTWEAPQEYLFALKLAQKNLRTPGSAEVSAAEWQMYQQALAERQKPQPKVAKIPTTKPLKNNDKGPGREKNGKPLNKRGMGSDDEDTKIELITSYYHNSDSESNDEVSPAKGPKTPHSTTKSVKNLHKKQKTKPTVVEYGPILPPNQNYTVPIGPEMPSDLLNERKPKSPESKESSTVKEEDNKSSQKDTEDQDDNILLQKLKDKAKLLEKLGGELPTELMEIIKDEDQTASPKEGSSKETNIDDLLNEIEKKEFQKVNATKVDMFDDKSEVTSGKNSPVNEIPSSHEIKPLFPSSKSIEEPNLFPSAETIREKSAETEIKADTSNAEKKSANLYLMDTNEPVEKTSRKKFRISNSVLPERKKNETPSYTTKYSQHIEGFSSERTGLGFSKDDEGGNSPKNTISYGNGLLFTKGETLNEDKRDDDLDDLTDLVEAKLKFLNQLQPCMLTAVQEMLIQMQTLLSAFRAGALSNSYYRRWASDAALALTQHEGTAAPIGWTCNFQRSEGRYQYRRESDGFTQWEYPATANMDMDICTTPPPPPIDIDVKEKAPSQPPLPSTPPPLLLLSRPATPPPPSWDPPPPGCDDVLPPPLPPDPPKTEIGDELASFYSDIAEMEKHSPRPHKASNSPELDAHQEKKELTKEKVKESAKELVKVCKKRTKVKISSSVGLKHKSVSNLVAKWQQVAEEVHSD